MIQQWRKENDEKFIFLGVCFFLFSQSVFAGPSLKEIYLAWAEKIGQELETISEPIMGSAPPLNEKEVINFAMNWKPREGEITFKSILLNFSYHLPELRFNPFFDTKEIQSQEIAKILNSRKAIKNDLKAIFPKAPEGIVWLGDGYHFCYYSHNTILGYLE